MNIYQKHYRNQSPYNSKIRFNDKKYPKAPVFENRKILMTSEIKNAPSSPLISSRNKVASLGIHL